MSTSFVIAAPWSNSGKTTITLGLARYFKNLGHSVQTYKCGPDYIDTKHHTTATGKPSINLDTVMMSETHLKTIFSEYKSEINIIEGVMGLFDGAIKDKGSTAEIAKLLDIPVVLVVNAKAMAYTIAPLLHGIKSFDTNLKIAGVIFNFIKTESHYSFLKEACDSVGIPSLGYIPPNDDISIPSRHLGLKIDENYEHLIQNASEHIGKHVDITELLNVSKCSNLRSDIFQKNVNIKTNNIGKIAVARDEAFNFIYHENINYLNEIGNVVFFSPIHDKHLPEADFIYLAGGYPELHLNELSSNTQMLNAINKAAKQGTKILAECGGMMYLGQFIIDDSGNRYNMANIFDFSTSIQTKKLHLGYRKVKFDTYELWGHEFHYSSISDNTTHQTNNKVYTARLKEADTKLYSYKNVLATYIHLYWAEGNFKWLFEN